MLDVVLLGNFKWEAIFGDFIFGRCVEKLGRLEKEYSSCPSPIKTLGDKFMGAFKT